MGDGATGRWTQDALARAGFTGWVPWSACPAALAAIPDTAGGVYAVLRADPAIEPVYLVVSPAGRFRGDPGVGRAALNANWVPGAAVVYIGKADHGRLRKRLAEYVDFGRGGSKPHWGGRLIWQLAESRDLLVAWRVLPPEEPPFDEETRLIRAFRADHGKPPFANDPHRLGR